jgi:hypothetical protein
MIKYNRFLVLTIFVFVALHGFSQAPGVEWEYSYWAPTHPINGSQTSNESGEDWFYDHKISLNALGKANGYICAGYSTYVEWAAEEVNGCYSNNPLGNEECRHFETINNRRGSNLAVISLVDLNGGIVWYKTYTEGWFYKVIQTSDGGYLGIGPTQSTKDENGLPLHYNPNQTTGNLTDNFSDGSACTKGIERRKVSLVKTDANGNIQWQYIYGMESYNGNGATAYSSRVVGWDVVETPNGDYRFTGCSQDLSNNDVMRTFVIEVAGNGYWKWGKYYGATDLRSIGIKIEKYDSGQGIKYIVAGEETFAPNNKNRAYAFQLDNTASPNPDWVQNYGANPNSYARISDLTINSNNELLLPVATDCIPCNYSANGEATGKVFKINTLNGNVIGTPVNLGTVKAFDLKIGITNTADGGYAIVSSKQNNGVPSFPLTSTNGFCNYDLNYWNTDAYVAKYSADDVLEWDVSFDATHTQKPPGNNTTWTYPDPQMRDLKSQECMYTIVQSPDGGFVVAGNNSANFDDSYLAKLESVCTDVTLDNITVTNVQNYAATNTITAHNFVVTPTGNVEFRAGNEIRMKPGFKASSGCYFHAWIDPALDCTPPYRKSLSNDTFSDFDESNFTEKSFESGFLTSQERVYIGEGEFNVFPNPTSGLLTINLPAKDNKRVHITVFDVYGKVVFTKISSEESEVSVNLSNLDSGVYFIALTNEHNNVFYKKILINK